MCLPRSRETGQATGPRRASLPLGELRPLAGLLQPGLLALLHARVAREKATPLELSAQRRVRLHQRARPGAYFRVLEPGTITAGDEIVVEHRPDHDVTMALAFRALTLEPELLPGLLAAGEDLTEDLRRRVERRAFDPA